MNSDYEAVIGLEVHVQLKTKSKMFCATSAEYFGARPNSHTCPVCLGLPGALPVVNEKALESAIKVGLALNCGVAEITRFDRKNYFYPDLPKGYQISQFALPIASNGYLYVGEKKIGITRAHLEEDTGKLIHSLVDSQKVSLIDFNRSGVPLLEIVSEPDLRSALEAKEYAKKLHQIMRYLGVADVDMEKAGMRFDGNVSVRKKGQTEYGTKVEVKNINSFRFLEKALNYEIERQIKALEDGETIAQETRGWVEAQGQTVSQRGKEFAHDYRYFPEPDLPTLKVDQTLVKSLEKGLPELPDDLEKRLQKDYGLTEADARPLVEEKELAAFFEEAAQALQEQSNESPKEVVNWLLGEVRRNLNEKQISLTTAKLEPAGLVELILLVKKGVINSLTAKEVLKEVLAEGKEPHKIVEEKGLGQKDESTLAKEVEAILKENPQAVEDYHNGKEAVLGFLLGALMRKLKGTANPEIAGKLLREELKNGRH